MLRKFSTILPWLLVIVLLVDRWRISKIPSVSESTIDSLKVEISKEESMVDSFFIVREQWEKSKDSSLLSIDTMGIQGLLDILRQNMNDYVEKNY